MVSEMEVDIPDHHSSVSSSDSRASRVACDHCHSDFPDVVALQSHAARCSVKAKKAVNARSVYLSGFKRSIDLQSAELTVALSVYGNVERVIPDHAWHRYAIVQMKTVEEAKKLIQMESLEMGNQRIHIKPAQLKPIPGEFEPQEFTALQIITELGKHSESHVIEQLQATKVAFGIDDESRDWRVTTIAFLQKLFAKFCAFKVTPNLFGSSISGFGTKYADVDINLTVAPPTEEQPTPMSSRDLLKAPLSDFTEVGPKATYQELVAMPKKNQLEFFHRILSDRMKRSHSILSYIRDIQVCKHSLIRFATHNKLLCEMSYENDFSARKAELLEKFTNDKHHILHRIIFVLRLWAQSQDIYGPSRKQRQNYFKSYAFSLLFTAYLQQKKILGPVTVYGSNKMDGWDVDYVFPEFFVEDDDAFIIGVIRGFFIFVAQEIPENSVISIRNGTIQPYDAFLEANAADERIATGFKKALLNVQDPLELSHNICSGVSSDCLSLLKKKAMRALAKLKKAPQGHQIASIFDLDDSACLSIAGSRVDDPELTFTVNLPKDTSGQLVLNAVEKLMEDVLKFERKDDTTISKRRRLNAGYGNMEYTTTAPVWLGRRKLKRELARKYPDQHSWQIEKLVTADLLEGDGKARNKAAKNTPLIQFGLTTRFDEETPTLTVVFTPIYGERATYNDVFRFLKTFFTNDNGKLIVEVLQDSVPDMLQELKLSS